MVKIKPLKKHTFTKILKLKWDLLEMAPTPFNYSLKIKTLLTKFKIHLHTVQDNVNLDKVTINSSFKGISLFLLTPQLKVLNIAEKDVYGYIFGMKVVMDGGDSNNMVIKYEDKILGEIKILNYE